MKKISYTEEWDLHTTTTYLYLNNEDKVIGKFIIEIDNDYIKLNSFYIQKEFRGQKYSTIMMNDFINLNLGKTFLLVRKNNFIISTYEKYGFSFYSDNEDGFIWMVKNKKEK